MSNTIVCLFWFFLHFYQEVLPPHFSALHFQGTRDTHLWIYNRTKVLLSQSRLHLILCRHNSCAFLIPIVPHIEAVDSSICQAEEENLDLARRLLIKLCAKAREIVQCLKHFPLIKTNSNLILGTAQSSRVTSGVVVVPPVLQYPHSTFSSLLY